ncbi:MAG: calcium-binding protein, partial [Desulfobacterales bacterium]|nr:calcium-binding protein [Desulfobacterales bacterium]
MGFAVAVDGSGNVYAAGYSSSTWGSPVNIHTAFNDAFAVKLNSSGVRQWHTFIGGANNDYCYAMAVDGSGNVYVAGKAGATWGSPVNAFAASYDAFAAKLNSSGVYQWHTFMG